MGWQKLFLTGLSPVSRRSEEPIHARGPASRINDLISSSNEPNKSRNRLTPGEPRLDSPRWIWQQADWPQFHWQAETLAPLLRACQQAQGRLLGMVGAIAGDAQARGELDTLLQNFLTSSAIEGETLNAASVRSSLARRLGVATDEGARITARSEGLAALMLDAIQRYDVPLDIGRLLEWHAWLFPLQDALLSHPIRVGGLCGDEPMQVVSGRIDQPTALRGATAQRVGGAAQRLP